eukprot:CAMPEP_0170737278 /NCGR_PEP_ID=MMETSP0437-20130122/4044_1 /TAXON_ID=0 /ORGANISM="Sexangularia sp." /LENGTH=371 /DNA_ID=CAMNT_0011075659 /DNA_START=3 /DNA_END=1118 /DNA_ORIENTATION=+
MALSTCDLVHNFLDGVQCDDVQVRTQDSVDLVMQHVRRSSAHPSAGPYAAAPLHVILQHGLLSSATAWTLNPANESLLGALFATEWNRPLDVWLWNARGNGISGYPPAWNFTFDQMALIDIPTMFAASVGPAAVNDTVVYVAVSQGVAMGLAALSSVNVDATAAFRSSLDLFVGFGPVAHVGHLASKPLRLLADMHTEVLLEKFGPVFNMSFLHTLLPHFCRDHPHICADAISFVFGASTHQNLTRFPFYKEYEPTLTSTLNMAHFSQEVRSGDFAAFDWGSAAANREHYGTDTPPQYDLSQVHQRLALYSGGKDLLADPTDVRRLIASLPQPPVEHLFLPTYAHEDFVMADDAASLLYPSVLAQITALLG